METNLCPAVGAVAITSNPLLAVFLLNMHVLAVVMIVFVVAETIADPE